MRRHGRNGHSKLYQECNQSIDVTAPRGRGLDRVIAVHRARNPKTVNQVTRPRVQRGGGVPVAIRPIAIVVIRGAVRRAKDDP